MREKASKKQMSKILLLCGLLTALTACGQESPEDSLVQEIVFGSGSENAAEAGSTESEADQEIATLSLEDEDEEGDEDVFAFSYGGVTLIPGAAFDRSALADYISVSNVPSCAFEGTDNVYDYGEFELIAYNGDDGESIYSIYFLDPNLVTTEGLSLGDTVSDMKALYGENYETDGSSYTYTKGKTLLIVIAQDDAVVSIEYRLNQ